MAHLYLSGQGRGCVTIEPMAQNLGEYRGVMDGGSGQISSGLDRIASAVEDALRNPTPTTWLGIAAFFFVLWFLFIRRK